MEEKSRSKRARPESPCSRRARALTRARAPPPPVTKRKNLGVNCKPFWLSEEKDETYLGAGEVLKGVGGRRYTWDAQHTDCVALDRKTSSCSFGGGEIGRCGRRRAGQGGEVTGGKNHFGKGATCEFIVS